MKITLKGKEEGDGEKEVEAVRVGKLAVHQTWSWSTFPGDQFVISSIFHGYKFPGETSSQKIALACAKELDEMFDWNTFERKLHKDKADEAKEILASWLMIDPWSFNE